MRNPMALLREGSIRLKDGRKLAFAESGDPSGLPVIFLHGNPGSRYMRHPDDSLTYGMGVRLITPDRPGYGLSDFQPDRTLLDCPSDIEQLANMLGLGASRSWACPREGRTRRPVRGSWASASLGWRLSPVRRRSIGPGRCERSTGTIAARTRWRAGPSGCCTRSWRRTTGRCGAIRIGRWGR